MNAAMQKYDMTEGEDMPVGENDNLGLQVAELRADVRHIQADVTELKAGQRVADQRVESLRRETAERIESVRKETAEGFAKVDQRFESVRKEIGEVKDSVASAKVWALGLYLALAGSLLYVLAKGFKWI